MNIHSHATLTRLLLRRLIMLMSLCLIFTRAKRINDRPPQTSEIHSHDSTHGVAQNNKNDRGYFTVNERHVTHSLLEEPPASPCPAQCVQSQVVWEQPSFQV